MKTKRWKAVLLVSALLLMGAGCNRQTTIRGTHDQIDQVITKLDHIDQSVAALIDEVIWGFFLVGFFLPFGLPLALALTDRDYLRIGKRCLYGALIPAAIAALFGLVLAIWPPAWQWVGVDPLYVKVVDATTNPAQKQVLTPDQTQNALAMRRQTTGYVVGKRGAFVMDNPLLVFASVVFASIIGALLAYIVYALLPNIYSTARRHQRTTRDRT